MSTKLGRRAAIAGAFILAGAAGWWLCPPFHVVDIHVPQPGEGAGFSARAVADKVWREQLPAAIPKTPDAAVVLAELQRDPPAAAAKYGHTVGIGGSTYYFVSGIARIIRNQDHSIELAIIPTSSPATAPSPGTRANSPTLPTLAVDTGLLFGNAIRDGSGLLDVNQYANSKKFNDISTELNKFVEQQVFPLLNQAAVGQTLHFCGIVALSDDGTTYQLTPVSVWAVEGGAK